MIESSEMGGARETPRRARRDRGRGRSLGTWIAGGVPLALVLLTLAFGVYTWWIGRLNPINALVFALAIAGTLPVVILQFRGDAAAYGRMDEGQREMLRSAQADALYVAYLGLFALFFGYLFFPAARADAPVHVGLLLLLVILIWYGSYMWRRWRP
jgi:hypothetical protein